MQPILQNSEQLFKVSNQGKTVKHNITGIHSNTAKSYKKRLPLSNQNFPKPTINTPGFFRGLSRTIFIFKDIQGLDFAAFKFKDFQGPGGTRRINSDGRYQRRGRWQCSP